MDWLSRLRDLLDEPAPATRERLARTWLDRAGEAHPPLVLFGAGHLGRKLHTVLAGSAFPVVAFTDNDPAKWGHEQQGLPILSPKEAAERFGATACFVVTIWRAEGEPHLFLETEAALRRLGVRHVAQFGHLAWVHPEGLLPHYSLDLPQRVQEAREAVLAALDLFTDAHSRDIFIRHALWRLTLDFALLPATDPDEIYFPDGLSTPGAVMVDAGAFDGDTCRRTLELWGDGVARIHAFEPDPANGKKFLAWMATSPDRDRLRFHPMALGAHPGILRFPGTGELNARASATEGVEVPCATLDEVLRDDPPDFIKMDIEGAEFDALQGATALLRRGPDLAICLYHVQDHLWAIPNFVHAHLPGHDLHLRYHGTDAWEVVLYAVKHRGTP